MKGWGEFVFLTAVAVAATVALIVAGLNGL